MRHLSTVEDRFEITGRGCVVVPGIPHDCPKDIAVRRGDTIELRKPDGTSLRTRIYEIEFCDGPGKRSDVAFLLPPEITKADVPVGTEIWLEKL